MLTIKYFNAFEDNYVWLIHGDEGIVVIDPSSAKPVTNYITASDSNLSAVLLTHSHHDHIAGLTELISGKKSIPIWGKSSYANKQILYEGELPLASRLNIQTIFTPGHTLDGVSYLLSDGGQFHLFCGDTLFSAGCGRVFTGDYALMLNSLNKIKQLYPKTLIYPAHEYTLKNLEFALTLEPFNRLIQQKYQSAKEQLYSSGITLPVTLESELTTNPFLRCDDINFQQTIEKIVANPINTPLDCFIAIRTLRNTF